MPKYELEEGIAIPEATPLNRPTVRRGDYPFLTMPVGASFALTRAEEEMSDEDFAAEVGRIRKAMQNYNKNHRANAEWDFRMLDGGGIRVWRIR